MPTTASRVWLEEQSNKYIGNTNFNMYILKISNLPSESVRSGMIGWPGCWVRSFITGRRRCRTVRQTWINIHGWPDNCGQCWPSRGTRGRGRKQWPVIFFNLSSQQVNLLSWHKKCSRMSVCITKWITMRIPGLKKVREEHNSATPQHFSTFLLDLNKVQKGTQGLDMSVSQSVRSIIQYNSDI